MNKTKLIILPIGLIFILVASSYGAVPFNPANIDIAKHLPTFEAQRYPLDNPYQTAWQTARTYILNEFQSYGLVTQSQNFQSKMSTTQNTVIDVDGVNIIGESSSSNAKAPVFVVGTHYDSTLTEIPLKENGVSVAVLLETAKYFQQLKQNGNFNQNTTILFVAFDLDIKNYIPNGPGMPGSTFFVQNWISEYMMGRQFLGALILDTISTFNTNINSQTISQGIKDSFPRFAQRIQQSGSKADFLALFSRPDLANQFEVQNLISRFQEANMDARYRIEDFTLQDGVKLSKEILDKVAKNPVHDFWTNSPPLPAMFLTDLEHTRTDFDAINCGQNCGVKEFWSQERATFVERITEAVVQLLLHNQQVGNDHTAPIIGNTSSILSFSYLNILLLFFSGWACLKA